MSEPKYILTIFGTDAEGNADRVVVAVNPGNHEEVCMLLRRLPNVLDRFTSFEELFDTFKFETSHKRN